MLEMSIQLVVPFFSFSGASKLTSKVTVPIYVPTSTAQGLLFPHIPASIWSYFVFHTHSLNVGSSCPCFILWRGFSLAYISDTCIKDRLLCLCGLTSLFCSIGLHICLYDNSMLSFILWLCSEAWDLIIMLRTALATWSPVPPWV